MKLVMTKNHNYYLQSFQESIIVRWLSKFMIKHWNVINISNLHAVNLYIINIPVMQNCLYDLELHIKIYFKSTHLIIVIGRPLCYSVVLGAQTIDGSLGSNCKHNQLATAVRWLYAAFWTVFPWHTSEGWHLYIENLLCE